MLINFSYGGHDYIAECTALSLCHTKIENVFQKVEISIDLAREAYLAYHMQEEVPRGKLEGHG